MTEEAKEILENIKETIENNNIEDITTIGYDTYPERWLKLLNYITNLQKEKDNYKQRNEKAVEWCECVINAKYTADKLPNGKMTDMGYCLDLAEPLLNILEGGDE